MNRFASGIAAFTLTTLVALTVLAATPAAPARSAVETRSTYDPFVMAREIAPHIGDRRALRPDAGDQQQRMR